jgi:hypothetical protein
MVAPSLCQRHNYTIPGANGAAQLRNGVMGT